jgi:hypothetical protein
METTTSIDWSLSGGEMMSFDDGHVPENLRNDDRIKSSQSTTGTNSTRLVNYPEFFERRPTAVNVLDNAVSSNLVDALYEATVQEAQPWGDYVTIEQVRDLWKQQEEHQLNAFDADSISDKEELALHAVASFLKTAMSQNVSMRYTRSKSSSSSNTSGSIHSSEKNEHTEPAADSKDDEDSPAVNANTPLLFDESDLSQAHGVAIWALAADVGSRVPYHLDYAEQIRYESNIIVPPALAGVLQCSSATVEGGEYCSHLDGLEHYEKHGYKGAKEEKKEGSADASSVSVLPVEEDLGWVQVPYKYNRMIWQSGHLPHLSTTVERISTVDTADKLESEVGSRTACPPKRVIVGFNVFLHDVGPTVQRAPEHSAAFRRKVMVERFLFQKRRFSLELVQQSPNLAKLLVWAKRQKNKQEFCQKQQKLNGEIQKSLQPEIAVPVGELMKRFGRSDGVWPSAVDVQVQIHHQCQEGWLSCVQAGEPHDFTAKKVDLVGSEEMVSLPLITTTD